MNNNKKYLILSIFGIIFMFFGGTLAYYQWESSASERTQVTFTVENDFKCSVDGGGDITSGNVMLAPASCTNSKYAIKRIITTNTEIMDSNISVSMDLWLDINSIDPELKNSTNFKYAITTNENSCTEGYINGGTLSEATVPLIDSKIYSKTTEEIYYLYIWLDAEETNPNTANKTFSLSLNGKCEAEKAIVYKESILNGTDPVLEEGMIPVTIDNNGNVTTADISKEWYSYENKRWANAVLVNSTNRANYYETDMTTIKANQPVIKSDILTYFVWIPKYSYKMNGKEKLISISFNETESGYNTHPAFTFGDISLYGFWTGKFETTGTGSKPTILPNVTSLTQSTSTTGISDFFKASLKLSGGTQSGSTVTFTGNNTYGLTANTNSHLMKNSEWGAVTYLSHSIYGIAEEVRINNNSGHKTGCGASIKDEGPVSTCQIKYGTPSNESNTYPQSTTGNISGIFDMSGGCYEYVMGNYNNEIGGSGFDTLPESIYYDMYPASRFKGDWDANYSYCTLETCGGHALHETKGWYTDIACFIGGSDPWFHRGGNYSYSDTAGIFNSDLSDGNIYYDIGFRMVIIKGV